MIRITKKNVGLLLLSVVLVSFFGYKTEVLAYDINPLNLIRRTAGAVAGGATEVYYFLTMQPKPGSEDVTMIPENMVSGLDILNITNTERAVVSLKPYTSNMLLDRIASLRADDLFANQYFEHESPDGKSAPELAPVVGYKYLYIGENLAMGDFYTDAEIVKAWMDSPGHKANILNDKYTELGVAVKEGEYKGGTTVIAVQIFGRPLANCAEPSVQIKALIDSSVASVRKMQTDALAKYNELNVMKVNPLTDKALYTKKAQEYNYFAKTVNDASAALKGIIDFYNIEVNKYNSCINS